MVSFEAIATKKNNVNFWATPDKHANKIVTHSYSEKIIWFFLKAQWMVPTIKCQRLKGKADIQEKP